MIPLLLSGKNYNKKAHDIKIKDILNNDNYPDGCTVNFDMAVIDIIEIFNKSKIKLKQLIVEEYSRIKDYVGEVPSRSALYKYMDYDIYIKMKQKSKLNIFNNYIDFVREEEGSYCDDLRGSFGEDFINMIENTSMSKLYKLPILLAFYNDGRIKEEILEDDIVKSFRTFYSNGQNMLDMLKDKSTKDFKSWDDKKIISLAYKNPIKFLLKSSGEYFNLHGKVFSLDKRLRTYINNENFIKEFKDVIDYKRLRFLKDNLLKKEEEIRKIIEGDG